MRGGVAKPSVAETRAEQLRWRRNRRRSEARPASFNGEFRRNEGRRGEVGAVVGMRRNRGSRCSLYRGWGRPEAGDSARASRRQWRGCRWRSGDFGRERGGNGQEVGRRESRVLMRTSAWGRDAAITAEMELCAAAMAEARAARLEKEAGEGEGVRAVGFHPTVG